jgi:hypothetical protein
MRRRCLMLLLKLAEELFIKTNDFMYNDGDAAYVPSYIKAA